MYILVQVSTAAILYTGANTSFNGFPALASFVAEDRFLPRQLMTRGYRLVFSNGIITLTALSVGLLIVYRRIGQRAGAVLRDRGVHRLLDGRLRNVQIPSDASRTGLAIQVGDQLFGGDLVDGRGGDFRGGQVHRRRLAGRRRLPRCWSIALIRLNREYRAEAAILEAFRTDRPELVKYARHRVFVLVNSLDLAVLEALRYGKGLRADELIAVHFMVDAATCRGVAKALG